MKAGIIVIGPFPPPTHGFAAMTHALATSLSGDMNVTRINVASARKQKIVRHANQVYLNLRAAIRILKLGLNGTYHISIGCNSRLGLLYTILLVTAARLGSRSQSLHHHSYEYLSESKLLMRVLTWVSPLSLTHVFLSVGMAERFESLYGSKCKSTVIQNAMFVPSSKVRLKGGGALRVGLLSNLSYEKGLHDFIDVARKAKESGLSAEFYLAGPTSMPSDTALIEEAVREKLLQHLGPVYGPEKDAFFQNIDLFLFPTRYRHEAQPTVIYEAFAAGVPVIAFDRGAIREQVGDCVKVVNKKEDFSEIALAHISCICMQTDEERTILRSKAVQRHEQHAAQGFLAMKKLFQHDGTQQ